MVEHFGRANGGTGYPRSSQQKVSLAVEGKAPVGLLHVVLHFNGETNGNSKCLITPSGSTLHSEQIQLNDVCP